MKAPLSIFCVALVLAGCRASPQGGLFQTRIPPPGTLPVGTLLADNTYYQAPAQPAAPSVAAPPADPAPLTRTDIFAPVERRGASLSRSPLSNNGPILAAAGREEPIRIAENAPLPSGLAAVVPIHGIPTTDVTSLFQTVRASLNPPANNLQPPLSRDYVEISQLPDPPGASRRAARSSQPFR